MSEHSPGPWQWCVTASNDVLVDAEGDPVIADGANARLIAEVPALLALARYAAERGEGDAEMAREILARIDGE
jgi:hypothetical protein